MVPRVFLNLSVSHLYYPLTDLCFSLCVGYLLSGNPGLTASCGEENGTFSPNSKSRSDFFGPVWTIFPLLGPVIVVEVLGKRVRGINRFWSIHGVAIIGDESGWLQGWDSFSKWRSCLLSEESEKGVLHKQKIIKAHLFPSSLPLLPFLLFIFSKLFS